MAEGMTVHESGQTWRVILEHVDDMRARLNLSCVHLEAWQKDLQIASYTLSLVFVVLYALDLASSERPLRERIRARVFYLLRTLPWVRRRLDEDLSRAKKEMEEEVHDCDTSRDFYKFLPDRAFSKEEILAEASLYRAMGGRRKGVHQGEPEDADIKDCVMQVSSLFGHSDARDSAHFPGVRKMESEIVRMCLSLFHGGNEAAGLVLPSASEATFVALSSARAAALRAGNRHPTVVASLAAHPSVAHAAHLLGMRVKRVKGKEDGSVDAGAIKRAVTSDTALIFVSAPNHITGTMDHIDAIAKMAQRYSVSVHVDCTLGGFVLPFMELADLPFPSFDFRIPGVSSISIDLSRFGRSSASCSLALFRDQAMMRRQVWCEPAWCGGIYSSVSLSHSLDGSAVAASWAALLSTGRAGFVDATLRIVDGTRRLASAIEEIDGVRVIGDANTVMVAFATTSNPDDIYHVIQVLVAKGWDVEPLTEPPAARILMTTQLADEATSAAFIDDLDTCLVQLANNAQLGEACAMRALHALVRTAADRWVVNELTTERALAHYSMPPPHEARRTMRTLSVEGRKMSMLSAHANMVERRKGGGD